MLVMVAISSVNFDFRNYVFTISFFFKKYYCWITLFYWIIRCWMLFICSTKPSYSFSEIKPYQDILQVSIPKKATYYHDDIFDFCFDSFVDISILYVTYNDNDGEKLAQDIKNSDFWLDSYEAEELYDILPISLQSEYEDDYYLIFNENTKQYNSLPNNDGKQHFIIMKYDSVYYRLYIYEYTLNYVK